MHSKKLSGMDKGKKKTWRGVAGDICMCGVGDERVHFSIG